MTKNGFCKFYKNLYWDDSIKYKNLVKWRLCHRKKQLTIFCVVRATNGTDQLEIIHNAFLSQMYYKEHPAYVYGIASGYSEALDIVVRISDEAQKVGKAGRLLDYLDKK
ncbi:MAG: hypothetical protein VZR06_03535 [Butyrivibrio sp.]|uniref:hypothetical protein n=1 Tax=Butyrivibrio sp. LB2008 TaxID=1408305 RepID=UPI00055B31B6|nr:hypothetical protein [Butyrivibrio sp. LB2008]MEE3494206.1 hypothetical protein [Butyrivibrio sp.]